jgi:membrane protein YdbS with pleckstrin-like domain
MVYFDYSQNRYVASAPALVPDVRAHLANWRQFYKATKTWPVLSIIAFLLRFVILIAAVIASLFYGFVREDWSRDKTFLIFLGILIPALILWYLVERAAWNHDLRRKAIASNSDVWGVNQFPPR